jgi:hypothetical protein
MRASQDIDSTRALRKTSELSERTRQPAIRHRHGRKSGFGALETGLTEAGNLKVVAVQAMLLVRDSPALPCHTCLKMSGSVATSFTEGGNLSEQERVKAA